MGSYLFNSLNMGIVKRIKRSFLCVPQLRCISTSPVPSHQQIAHLILEQKTANEALETFRWACKLPSFTHTQATYRALIHKLCTFRRFDTVQQLLDEMPSSVGCAPDEDVFITVIRGFGRARMIKQVIKVLEMISKLGKIPSLKVYNSILDVLVKEDIDIARMFYRKKMMACGVEGDDYTYGILMKGLCLTNRIGDGFKLLQVMKTRGICPNAVIYNTLIHSLCRNGKVGRARSLMSEIAEPNDVTFNTMISAYCKEDNLVQALVMLEKSLTRGFVPDAVSVTKVLEALCNVGRAFEAIEVLERVEKMGGALDIVAYNTLVKGFCRLGKLKIARNVVKEMELKGFLPTADTYNALISGLCDSRILDSAMEMFDEMKRAGLSWNFTTFDTLIRGLCSGHRTEEGLKILELMEENSKRGCNGQISPYNSIIYGLYKENRIDEALEFLKKMEKLFPRATGRSLEILRLCGECNVEDAKKVYAQMIEEGSVPSSLVYAKMVQAFCEQELVKEALEVLNDMVVRGHIPDVSTMNAVIRELCRQGRVGNAVRFMDDMVARGCSPDCDSYGLVIVAFCGNGHFQAALRLFMQMVENGVIPNHNCWSALVVFAFQEAGLSLGKKQLDEIVAT